MRALLSRLAGVLTRERRTPAIYVDTGMIHSVAILGFAELEPNGHGRWLVVCPKLCGVAFRAKSVTNLTDVLDAMVHHMPRCAKLGDSSIGRKEGMAS